MTHIGVKFIWQMVETVSTLFVAYFPQLIANIFRL